jgi:hypothetical protein
MKLRKGTRERKTPTKESSRISKRGLRWKGYAKNFGSLFQNGAMKLPTLRTSA